MARRPWEAMLCAVLVSSLASCGGGVSDVPEHDAGNDLGGGDAAAPCTSDSQCDDGAYCNGAERCMAGAMGADARGCVSATMLPCMAPMVCDEATHTCVARVCTGGAGDEDGDGHDSPACGGDD